MSEEKKRILFNWITFQDFATTSFNLISSICSWIIWSPVTFWKLNKSTNFEEYSRKQGDSESCSYLSIQFFYHCISKVWHEIFLSQDYPYRSLSLSLAVQLRLFFTLQSIQFFSVRWLWTIYNSNIFWKDCGNQTKNLLTMSQLQLFKPICHHNGHSNIHSKAQLKSVKDRRTKHC